ncbi:MAG: hypothetical protein ABI699_00560 [Caldimonas sp.]
MSQPGTVGPLLAQGPVDRYRPMGAFGRPAYESHVQLRAALLARLGLQYANYFSRPTFDAEQRNIRWTAETSGAVSAWSALGADRRQQLEPVLAGIRDKLQAYVKELKGDAGAPAKSGGHALASLIEQATKVPDESHLHLVGEQPVLSFWGFENQTGSSIDAALLAQAGSRGPIEAEVVTPLVAPAVAPAKEEERRAGFAWWRWLLALLLLLLLALLLLWLLRCTAPVSGWFASDGWAVRWWPELAVCRAPPPGPLGLPPTPDPEPLKPPEVPPELPKVELPKTVPADPRRMTVPEEALRSGDLSFLAHKWELGPRMAEVTPDGTRLGVMIDTLRFDAKGRGVYESIRENGFGPCRGPARAWIENGKLRIETETCVGRQRSLVGKSIECERLADGTTKCSGRNTGAAFKGSVSERFRAWLTMRE